MTFRFTNLRIDIDQLGDSIAVNGTCLTVTEFNEDSFVVGESCMLLCLHYFTLFPPYSSGLAPETLRKTSLSELKEGSFVNLERSLKPDSRMGGHFVQVS